MSWTRTTIADMPEWIGKSPSHTHTHTTISENEVMNLKESKEINGAWDSLEEGKGV